MGTGGKGTSEGDTDKRKCSGHSPSASQHISLQIDGAGSSKGSLDVTRWLKMRDFHRGKQRPELKELRVRVEPIGWKD